jgi:hypothetical protein
MSSSNKYAVLMETNGKEYESWYYFIKYNGNEDALKSLSRQIESIDWYILDDLSTFDLDLEHLVSETTAKEMIKIELNSLMFHRKFDGKLKEIDLGFKKKDSNDKKIVRAFKKLGIGRIDDFIDQEDIDPEDLEEKESDDESNDESDDDYHYEISSEDEDRKKESDSEDEKDKKKKKKDKGNDKLEKLKSKMRS